ncbi:MAG TPA: FlxA-like family protein [Rhodocyclaceae bacterium]|nr:FlxA-like family protein [Rhodocyclaceae bacterium]
MVQAIGSASVANGFRTDVSAGVLEAQLNRFQVQLADWCNCPSGKTPEGKAKIQQIQDKADAVKAQLERIAATKATQSSASNQANVAPSTRTTTTGTFLDTFA